MYKTPPLQPQTPQKTDTDIKNQSTYKQTNE